MPNALYAMPNPSNEPGLGFLPGSPERAALHAEIDRQKQETIEIPLIIGGREVRTGTTTRVIVPHEHGRVLATVHLAGEREIRMAIEAAAAAKDGWDSTRYVSRAAIFHRAAALLSGPRRTAINAATMLNQSKTCHQADIDAVCELVDFFRFNCRYMEEIYRSFQPPVNPDGVWNTIECRPLEGFVYAVTPFNFTSIAANLPHAPALMGNTCIWKPSPHAAYSNYLVMRLMMEAGLPPGVINFVPADAEAITKQLVAHPDFAGLHYTGSTTVFRSIWKQIAGHLDGYRSYPRIVGETGGKDFIVAHPSAQPEALIAALIRGAYEYQGQKCSAASRCYLPRSIWDAHRDRLLDEIATINVGDPAVETNFMGAVIHQRALDKCRGFIEEAKASPDAEILAGGGHDDSTGYFVEPTLIVTTDPTYRSMCEEIFGPILTVFVYEDADYERTLRLCDETSPYALTGAVFVREQAAVNTAQRILRNAAGNFYINDKPTGAIVGQQPFGGARASGTNDKAGSPLNLLRWVSPRTVKETYVPVRDYRYPYMRDAGQ